MNTDIKSIRASLPTIVAIVICTISAVLWLAGVQANVGVVEARVDVVERGVEEINGEIRGIKSKLGVVNDNLIKVMTTLGIK